MTLTASTMLPLGTKAPHFELPDAVNGDSVSLDALQGKKALLVMFICNHCPYVQHVKYELAKLGKDYLPLNIGIIAISSNDANSYPDDSPEKLKEMAQELGFAFPFCYDATQAIAKAYQAACTPDFYLFDGQLKLVYRGQLDDSRPGNDKPVNGQDLRAAIEAVLNGRLVNHEQKNSVGCNIKWKLGNEPKY